jgi:PiT family inorganic phosphate transporter
MGTATLLEPPHSETKSVEEPPVDEMLVDQAVFAAPLNEAALFQEKLKKATPGRVGLLAFSLIMIGGLTYIATQIGRDLSAVHTTSVLPYVMLGLALAIALGFEFVNGFHDTANAVATVIYTNSLEPHIAVVFSGILNFVGVLFSSGAVAFTILQLFPAEMILRMNKGSGFAMIFALLLAAILWNLATWYGGLPTSSSHTLIGSIVGAVGTFYLMQGKSGMAGVNWETMKKVFEALLISPVVGFSVAGLLFLLFKLVAKDKRLYDAPRGNTPPPFYIRALLVLTCGGVSYAHGSNDGQKGMGLIMLILVGTMPTAYALNHSMDAGQVQSFAVASTQVAGALDKLVPQGTTGQNPNAELERFVRTKKYEPQVALAVEQTVVSLRDEVMQYGTLARIPQTMQADTRNHLYLTGEALRLIPKSGGPKLSAADAKLIADYQDDLNRSTQFIPSWVKVAVALALGMGTMIGWRRIVITVGEKIGKTRMTYAQGASAQMVAMTTILAAGSYGLPVSTTHVLSSSVAGAMTANHSGLQWETIRNIAMAWVLTLPAAALLSGGLFWLFNSIAK